MNTMQQEQAYTNFLEVINVALDIESLYLDTFHIIQKTFNTDRVQIWEKISNVDEMSVSYEYFEGNKNSMLKFRIPLLSESTRKNTEKTNVWEYTNISNDILTKNEINSLLGIDFRLPEQSKGILILTSKEKSKKYSEEDIKFLIKLKNQLENGTFKVEKFQKSQDELRRLLNQNNKLREQDRLRTNFINNISHELRSPLVSILGFSKMLFTNKHLLENPKEIADQIYQAANRLSTLITDFLQINKIDTEGWFARAEVCDIGEIIKQTVEEFASLNKEHKISYRISDNYPIIKTDPKLFRQVLDNLISNAIKYSPSGGNITISLQAFPSQNEIIVSISDQGIGISKEEISKVFDRFFRSSNLDIQDFSGSGLGLAICKEIVNSLNGKIEAESELNKGSKFSFTLPIN